MDIKDDKGKVIAKVSAADPNTGQVDEGLWIEIQADDGTRPTVCLIKQKAHSTRTGVVGGGWYLGLYRDVKHPQTAGWCDFAISFTDNGLILQVVKEANVKVVNLFDLLSKLGE